MPIKRRKRISNRRYSKYSSVKLYLDDIELMINAASSRGFSVKFLDKNYEYDSLEDVVETHGNYVDELEIIFSKEGYFFEHITVKIGDYFLLDRSVTLSSDSRDESLLVYHEIDAIIKSRVARYSSFLRRGDYLIAGFVLLGFIPRTMPYWWVFPVMLYFFSLISFIEKWRLSGLSLKRKYEDKGFFANHKQRLIDLILGAIITLITQYLIKII